MQEQESSTEAGLIDRLAACQTLAGLPPGELEWLAANGRVIRFEEGSLISRTGEPIHHLYILLAGHIAIDVDRGAGPRRVMEWRAGDISGLLPYSRLRGSPGDTFAHAPTDALAIDRDRLPEMIRECPQFTALCVHTMLDRARNFNSSDLHDEKMLSLGKLAAGLAHELNNPASAAVRGAKMLAGGIADIDLASRTLGAMALNDAQLAVVERVREACLATPVSAVLSPIERADREDEIAAWIDARDADPDHAAPLADTPVTLASLDELAGAVPAGALDAVLGWIAAGCTARAVALDIEKAATRMHDLVSVVKKFTYMDRLAGPELVDVGAGLRDTLAMVAAKARAKSVAIATEIDPGLPSVLGTGGELNQVWLNLIDNALDAVAASGHVRVSARRELDQVVVRIIDDGPGVPPGIREQIFDPFFTTKPPGQGTGLGLDIARRLVRRYNGDIDLRSQPGRTEFSVRLPASETGAEP
jgi:signal transduction histidine kinase